jgi:glycosyltransferase involved in cell wall biosynthesis
VLTIHDLYFIGYLGRRRSLTDLITLALARAYASRAAAIIADSSYSQRAIISHLGVEPSRIRVIPLALGREFRPTPCPPGLLQRYGILQPYVLYVGNFMPHKNLARLIEGFAGLPQTIRESHQLVLAGGSLRGRDELYTHARRLGLERRVCFPGWIESTDLPGLYSACTAFVLPSLEEGFGLPALEALACGAPVAASDRAAVPEVVGDAGVLFDPVDIRAISSALERLLGNTALRQDLVRRGRARAQEFSRQRTSGRVLSLLDEVSKQGRWHTLHVPNTPEREAQIP